MCWTTRLRRYHRGAYRTTGVRTWVFFNVADADASYQFADALFNKIVDSSGEEIEVFDAWDQASAGA